VSYTCLCNWYQRFGQIVVKTFRLYNALKQLTWTFLLIVVHRVKHLIDKFELLMKKLHFFLGCFFLLDFEDAM
jgi:hypothetical protein